MARHFNSLAPVFTVYLLRDGCGHVRYVGMGTPARPAHSARQHKMRAEIAASGLYRADALRLESLLISMLGPEMLLNRTVGRLRRRYDRSRAKSQTVAGLMEFATVPAGRLFRGVVRSKLTGRVVFCGRQRRRDPNHALGEIVSMDNKETMLIAILNDWRIEDAA